MMHDTVDNILNKTSGWKIDRTALYKYVDTNQQKKYITNTRDTSRP